MKKKRKPERIKITAESLYITKKEKKEAEKDRKRPEPSLVLLGLYMLGILGMLLAVNEAVGLPSGTFILVAAGVELFSAVYWFVFFKTKYFIHLVFVLLLFALLTVLTNWTNVRRIIYAYYHGTQTRAKLSFVFMVMLAAVVAFMLFSLEFILRNHSILFLVNIVLITLGPLLGMKVNAFAVVLIIIFQFGFYVLNMTNKRYKRQMAAPSRKKIAAWSAAATALLLIAAFVPAFVIQKAFEEQMFVQVYQADGLIQDGINKLSGSYGNGVIDGTVGRGNLRQTGKTLLNLRSTVIPQDRLYLKGFIGNYYNGDSWEDAYIHYISDADYTRYYYGYNYPTYPDYNGYSPGNICIREIFADEVISMAIDGYYRIAEQYARSALENAISVGEVGSLAGYDGIGKAYRYDSDGRAYTYTEPWVMKDGFYQRNTDESARVYLEDSLASLAFTKIVDIFGADAGGTLYYIDENEDVVWLDVYEDKVYTYYDDGSTYIYRKAYLDLKEPDYDEEDYYNYNEPDILDTVMSRKDYFDPNNRPLFPSFLVDSRISDITNQIYVSLKQLRDTTEDGTDPTLTDMEQRKAVYIHNTENYNVSDPVVPYGTRYDRGYIEHLGGTTSGYYCDYYDIPELDMSGKWDDYGAYELFTDLYYEESKYYYGFYDQYQTPRLYQLCKDNPLTDLNEITTFILWSLQTRAEYSKTPGSVPFNKNTVEYFMFDNGRGYCVHFASAAALMYRMYGIPSRYVTGFSVPSALFKQYADRPDKDTGLMYEADVTDYYAHAWVEIFLKDYGWVPVDVTPTAEGRMNVSYPGYDRNEMYKIMSQHGWSFRTLGGNADGGAGGAGGAGVAFNVDSATFRTVLLAGTAVLAAAFVCIMIIRRRYIRTSIQRMSCRRAYDRIICALHYAGLLKDHNGSEGDFPVRLSETVSAVSADDAQRLYDILLRDNYSDVPVTDEEVGFVREIYERVSSELYGRISPPKKPVYKLIKGFY